MDAQVEQTVVDAELGALPVGGPREPLALILRRAGNELITNPRGSAKAAPRQRGYPVSTAERGLLSAWSMLLCLAGLSTSPQIKEGKRPGRGSEACALATSGASSPASLPEPPSRRPRHGKHGR